MKRSTQRNNFRVADNPLVACQRQVLRVDKLDRLLLLRIHRNQSKVRTKTWPASVRKTPLRKPLQLIESKLSKFGGS